MTLRPNNSFAYQPYEPEYGKYGGPAGVELAEWHFRHSSDLVIEAFRTLNVHLRTVTLGTSAQLMMVMAGAFLPDARSSPTTSTATTCSGTGPSPAPTSSAARSTTATTPP